MKIKLFYHTLVSDWNHGNAHFLRGVVSDLIRRGHDVVVWEPKDSWSRKNLIAEHGEGPIEKFQATYPDLRAEFYDRVNFDPAAAVEDADLVIVHEWSDHELVRKIGALRKSGAKFHLLFHDTHHRMVSDPASMAAYDLSGYEGVLAFGEVLSRMYREQRPELRVWTWHEAADTRVFKPVDSKKSGDLIWIGNWGDDERRAELKEFLIDPVRDLGVKAKIHGVRYPADALEQLRAAGIEYGNWLPNFEAPRVFGEYRFTVHVPRRPYAAMLPGIPTIRVFEALACGIPLISAPWEDAENLFMPGKDFIVARNGGEMRAQMRELLAEPERARELAAHGLRTIQRRHTCAHRVEQLLGIYDELKNQ